MICALQEYKEKKHQNSLKQKPKLQESICNLFNTQNKFDRTVNTKFLIPFIAETPM